jgi:catechol 2,3-dioxygenase-like lactoylglutathione lyase family enzyme
MADAKTPKERVTGIGGVFLRARQPKRLAKWYRDHLGIDMAGQVAVYRWRSPRAKGRIGHTVWALFGSRDHYFGSGSARAMLNYRVRDLDRILAVLRRERVEVRNRIEESRYGRFGWVTDPEGNPIELWEPPPRYVTTERHIPME